MTFSELWKKFAATGRRAPNTLAAYFKIWSRFLDGRAHLRCIQDIQERDLTDFYRSQLRSPRVSEITAGQNLRALLTVLNWAVKQEYLLVNPGAELKVAKPRRPMPKVVSAAEMVQLLERPRKCKRFCIRYRDSAWLELMYATGMRAHELLALDLRDVDLAEGTVHIRGGKGLPRHVPLTQAALQALSRYLKESRGLVAQEGETALFVSIQGFRMNHGSLSSQLARYGKAIGLERLSPHDIRRAVATHLLENGADLVEIARLLGHRDLNSTVFYTQVMPVEMLREHRRYHPRAQRRRDGGL